MNQSAQDLVDMIPGVLFFITGVMFLVLTLCTAGTGLMCSRIPYNTGVESRFDVLSGCYVKPDNSWIPYDVWKRVGP